MNYYTSTYCSPVSVHCNNRHFNVSPDVFTAACLPSILSGQCTLHAWVFLPRHSRLNFSITSLLSAHLISSFSYNTKNWVLSTKVLSALSFANFSYGLYFIVLELKTERFDPCGKRSQYKLVIITPLSFRYMLSRYILRVSKIKDPALNSRIAVW